MVHYSKVRGFLVLLNKEVDRTLSNSPLEIAGYKHVLSFCLELCSFENVSLIQSQTNTMNSST